MDLELLRGIDKRDNTKKKKGVWTCKRCGDLIIGDATDDEVRRLANKHRHDCPKRRK